MIVSAFGPTTASSIRRYMIDPIPAYVESWRAKKSGNPVTLLFYAFSSGFGYAGASYLSGHLCDNQEAFEKNITNYVTYKVKYPRR